MARALLSVSDKQGIVDLAKGLAALGYEIVATGRTAAQVEAAGVVVRTVESVTGAPEMLGGRVKTLHPAIHGGILARRDEPDDMAALEQHGIVPIDVVVSNLYPFREAVRSGAPLAEATEQIDIGGPSLLRAAAKNHRFVTVVVDPEDYPDVLRALGHGGLDARARMVYAQKAFAHTAAYDSAIAGYLLEQTAPSSFPAAVTLAFEGAVPLRYGENPHQAAAFYRDLLPEAGSIATAVQLGGKELSYNNLMDADAAWRLVREFEDTAAVAVKHASPCGVALGPSVREAFERARDADREAIFGGIVAFNRPLDEAAAEAIGRLFLEVVVAPRFEPAARDRLLARRDLRLLEVPLPDGPLGRPPLPVYQTLKVGGGILLQERDALDLDPGRLQVVSRRAPSDAEMDALRFAWRVVKHVRSNAIVLARDGRTTGIGGGNVSRVGAVRVAVAQAGGMAWGSVMASDAFFPMADGVEEAARAGVSAVIQPGGSKKDPEVIEAIDSAGMAMVTTGIRHFRHS
jgi:phosphoribosylaminoimidazolecarboxamide formyltransferase / IMP cyclohydrolase